MGEIIGCIVPQIYLDLILMAGITNASPGATINVTGGVCASTRDAAMLPFYKYDSSAHALPPGIPWTGEIH